MRPSLVTRSFLGAALSAGLALAACANGEEATGSAAAPASSAMGTTYADLKSELMQRSVGSVDEMLEVLSTSERFRALVRNPVLEEVSFAIHGREVSPRFPRIVMHDGNVLMHTLGDPSSPAAQSVELMELVPEDRRFHYRVINFAAKDTPNWFVDEAEHADFTTMGPAFDGFIECAMCHALEATESRPRWPTSPIWQTPYGKVNERIAPGSKEMVGWQSFEATLADPEKGRRYRTLGLSRTETASDGALVFLDRPNAALAQAISRMNRQRVARIITTSTGFATHEIAVVGAFFGCSRFEEFLPEPQRDVRRAELIAHLESFQNAIFPTVRRSDVDPAQLATLLASGKFGSREVRGRPDMVMLLDQELLRMSPLDTITVLERLARGTGETTLTEMLTRRDTSFDLTGFSWNGADYTGMPVPQVVASLKTEDDAYYPIVARLRYLMEDTVTERPLYWSTATPFSFGYTYRFGDGEGGLLRVLSDEIGPRFLADHPELDRFKGHVVSPDRLTMDRESYCDMLRTASVDALR
jgi:hypothetical protein